MADLSRKRVQNVQGRMYVDASCIDCGTCRWVAPDSFDEAGGQSRVWRQPETPHQRERALMALVACPTASIGSTEKENLSRTVAAFPDPIADNVYHCGYHSEKSYGAASYLIRRPAGNVLVDSPRFARPLVKRLEDMGGIALMFLTHRDDVADHAAFAKHFGCTRIIHADDVGSGTREVERTVAGYAPEVLADDLLIVPVPGHTRGSMCLLHNKFLFTGDHLHWEPDTQTLGASRHVCWYDWREQTRSMERLLDYDFEWVLPGHGRRANLPTDAMRRALAQCVADMKTQ
jgi:glyoxylase-like metal-dependent hydrolase (beta-lactamase superfamily II)/ferredoxin